MKRNPSIELYRIFLMLGICTLHAVYATLGSFHWLDTGLAWCVDGFVFITGYFGCRFDWRKVIRLELTALWCGLIIATGWWLFARSSICSAAWLQRVGFSDIPNWGFCGYAYAVRGALNAWFLTAYVLMLCLVPLVNLALDAALDGGRQGLKVVVPILAAVFGWGLFMELPVFHRWIPRAAGLGSFTALTLLACYICGRLFRHYENRIRIKTPMLFVALVLLLVIDTFGYGWLGHYTSPFAVLTAAVVFMLFQRVHVGPKAACFILMLSPSMFAVYLLSGFRARFDMMAWIVDQIKVGPRPVACVISGVAVFIVCCIVDIPRRVFARCIRNVV